MHISARVKISIAHDLNKLAPSNSDIVARDFYTEGPDAFFDPSTPQFDGAIAAVGASGTNYIDGLLSGRKWNLSTITFSFPDESTDYESGYADDAPLEDFGQLSQSQQSILRAALDGNTWR